MVCVYVQILVSGMKLTKNSILKIWLNNFIRPMIRYFCVHLHFGYDLDG